MTPLALEWVQKAEGDFLSAEWLMEGPAQTYDAVGFHAQQCVEKYLKARLQEAGTPFPKTHDLERLLELVLPIEPSWARFRSDAAFLSRFAVETRYPGIFAISTDAEDAMRMCTTIREAIRQSLGLPA